MVSTFEGCSVCFVYANRLLLCVLAVLEFSCASVLVVLHFVIFKLFLAFYFKALQCLCLDV